MESALSAPRAGVWAQGMGAARREGSRRGREGKASLAGSGWTAGPDCRGRGPGRPTPIPPPRPSPARSAGAPPPGQPQVRERPHFSSRRSGRHSAFCAGSVHWADSTDAPPRAPKWPIERGFIGRRTRGIVTVLRRCGGSLGLSGLCPPAPGPSPQETSGTRARRGARGASAEPLEISASHSPRGSPACPRVDARVAKGSLQTLPHIGDAAPLREQVSGTPPDWKAAPGPGSPAGPGARARGGGAQAAGGARRSRRRGSRGGDGGARGRRAAGSSRRPRPRPARAGSSERSGCARSGLGREVPRQRERRRRRLVRLARRAAAARGEHGRGAAAACGRGASAAVGPGPAGAPSAPGPAAPTRRRRAPGPPPRPAGPRRRARESARRSPEARACGLGGSRPPAPGLARGPAPGSHHFPFGRLESACWAAGPEGLRRAESRGQC